MAKYVSKSQFKPKAFEYLRLVEKTNTEIYITDHGKPVVKIVPYKPGDDEDLKELRGLVVKYDDPLEPVDVEWDVLK
jgi:prevent-host-death family protein